MHRLEEAVRAYLQKHSVGPGNHLLVACSGGPDSTALLQALHVLKDGGKYALTCVYLDHGIRTEEEISADAALVGAMAAKNHIPFHVRQCPPGMLAAKARAQTRSLEEVAREWRYANLKRLARDASARFVALGHTQDDQIETLIMRFFQGVAFTGLVGIPERRGMFLRPLCECTRGDVTHYIQQRELASRTDSTNEDEKYLRNRTRRHLVPAVQKIFPHFRSSLISFSKKMSSMRDFLDEEARNRLNWVRAEGIREKGFRINGRSFLLAPGLIRLHSLYQLYDRITGLHEGHRSYRLPYRFLKPVMDTSRLRAKGVLLRGHGVRLAWEGTNLFFGPDIVAHTKKGYLIVVEAAREFTIEGTGLVLRLEDEPNPIGHRQGGIAGEIAAAFPIIVRSRKPGDSILTRGGRKSLKKLYSEWKIPADLRWKVPVLADREGVLAVMGERLGFKNRFSVGINDNTNSARVSRLTVAAECAG